MKRPIYKDKDAQASDIIGSVHVFDGKLEEVTLEDIQIVFDETTKRAYITIIPHAMNEPGEQE